MNLPKPSAAPAIDPQPQDLSPSTADDVAEMPLPDVSTEEGMRYYKAILGHEPTVDPEAPDVPGMGREADGPRNWAQDLASFRDDMSRKLQATLKRRPNWRELMDAMTLAAARRIDEARKRLNKRNAA